MSSPVVRDSVRVNEVEPLLHTLPATLAINAADYFEKDL